jgi:hypothetical protein
MHARTLFLEARKLLPLALVLVSASIIAIPACRVESTIALHRALLTAESFWIVSWAARHRYLSKTHHQTVQAVVIADPRRRLPIFDQTAALTGFVALLVLAS